MLFKIFLWDQVRVQKGFSHTPVFFLVKCAHGSQKDLRDYEGSLQIMD